MYCTQVRLARGDFLEVRGASTSSKRLLLDAKDHLRASAVYGSSPIFNFSPTYKIGRAAPSSTRWHALTGNKASAQLSGPFAQILPSFILSFTCHCFDGKLKKLLPWLSLYVPLRGSLQKRSLCFYVLNTFWPIRLINDDVRCNNNNKCIVMSAHACDNTNITTNWFPSTPHPITLTGPGTLRVKSIPCSTLIGSYSSNTGRGTSRVVGDHSIGGDS